VTNPDNAKAAIFVRVVLIPAAAAASSSWEMARNAYPNRLRETIHTMTTVASARIRK
jgi:hypothetical protein